MKSVIKWIVFVPVFVLTSLLTLFVGINGSGAFLGLNVNSAAEIVIFSVLGLLVFNFVMSLFDKTTSPVYILSKNLFCGVTAVASAFLLSAYAALDFPAIISGAEFGVMDIITIISTALAGISLLFVGLNHFSGQNTPKPIAILYLAVPLWCAIHLIGRFLDHTATPVAAAETMDLVMFVGFALFSIYAVMIHALIPGKNAVKSTICMGFPTVCITFSYAISQALMIGSQEDSSFLSYVPAMCYAALGLYVLGFVAELSFKSKTVYEQVVLPVEDEDEIYGDDTSDEDTEDAKTEESKTESSDYEGNAASEDICDESEDYDSESVNEPAVSPRVTEDDNAVSELFEEAKAKDSKTKIDYVTGSEDGVIIKDETEIVYEQKHPAQKGPSGKTTREAVLLDEDFILSVDGEESPENINDAVGSVDDFPDFVNPNERETAEDPDIPKSYVSRLDEIDRLILSIQGGEFGNSKDDVSE